MVFLEPTGSNRKVRLCSRSLADGRKRGKVVLEGSYNRIARTEYPEGGSLGEEKLQLSWHEVHYGDHISITPTGKVFESNL